MLFDALRFTAPLGKDELSAIYNGVDAFDEIFTLAGFDLPGAPVAAVIEQWCDGLPPPGLDVLDTGYLPRLDYTAYVPPPASPHDCGIYAAAYTAIQQQLELLAPGEPPQQQVIAALGKPLHRLVEHAIAAAHNAVTLGPFFDRFIAALPPVTPPAVTVAIPATDESVLRYQALMIGLFVGSALAIRQTVRPDAYDGWEDYVLGRHVEVFGEPADKRLIAQCLDAAFQPDLGHTFTDMPVFIDVVAIARQYTLNSINTIVNAYEQAGAEDLSDVPLSLCGAYLALALDDAVGAANLDSIAVNERQPARPGVVSQCSTSGDHARHGAVANMPILPPRAT